MAWNLFDLTDLTMIDNTLVLFAEESTKPIETKIQNFLNNHLVMRKVR